MLAGLSRVLVFLGAGVELSKAIPLASTTIAGMLLGQGAVFELLYLAVTVAAPPRAQRAYRREANHDYESQNLCSVASS